MKKNPKARLRAKADKLWRDIIIKKNPICEGCGEEPSITGHHFFPKGQFGHLRYNIENGISLCMGCHFAHHHKGDPTIHLAIEDKRGYEWCQKLAKISREKPASYQTIGYYKGVINELNKYE